MDTPTNTRQRHAGWLEHQRREAADRAALEEAARRAPVIVAYENGDLSDRGSLILFGQLIASGQAWTLQGSYGRTAVALIREGLIGQDGAVDWDHAESVGIERPLIDGRCPDCDAPSPEHVHADWCQVVSS